VMQQNIRNGLQNVVWLNKHLQQQHPKRRLVEKSQHLDISEITLIRLMKQSILAHQNQLKSTQVKLLSHTPAHQIRTIQNTLNLQNQDLKNLVKSHLQLQQQELGNIAGKLDALSPLATLQRGFSITMKGRHVIKKANEVKVGDEIQVRLMEGALECKVDKIV
jgi:exodeoxyribonuclease VII large subunit